MAGVEGQFCTEEIGIGVIRRGNVTVTGVEKLIGTLKPPKLPASLGLD